MGKRIGGGNDVGGEGSGAERGGIDRGIRVWKELGFEDGNRFRKTEVIEFGLSRGSFGRRS